MSFPLSMSITVAGIAIHQDDQGRYNINDLHKAAGGEKRHQPANWLRSDQAKELIAEFDKPLNSITPQIRGVEQNQAVSVKPGSPESGGGTFVVRELVYAYAMWVSAAFHLRVIGTYDAVVQERLGTTVADYLPPATTKALPGKLSVDSQDLLKQAVRERLQQVPKERQGSAARTIWGALNAKFATKGQKDGYKNIPEAAIQECLSLVARVPLAADTAPAVNPFDFSDEVIQGYLEAKLRGTRFMLYTAQNGTMFLHSVPHNALVATLEELPNILLDPQQTITNPQTMLPKIIQSAAQRLQA